MGRIFRTMCLLIPLSLFACRRGYNESVGVDTDLVQSTPCRSHAYCQEIFFGYGHKCIPYVTSQPSTDDSDSGMMFGYCDTECNQELCPSGMECTRPRGNCENVDCGRYVNCEDTFHETDLYCQKQKRSCHRLSGVCGQMGDMSFDCPAVTDWHGDDVVISCEKEDPNDNAGECRASRIRLQTPFTEGVENTNIDIVSPVYGQSVAKSEDMRIVFSGTKNASFVLISTEPFTSVDDIMYKAIWGIVIGPGLLLLA